MELTTSQATQTPPPTSSILGQMLRVIGVFLVRKRRLVSSLYHRKLSRVGVSEWLVKSPIAERHRTHDII